MLVWTATGMTVLATGPLSEEQKVTQLGSSGALPSTLPWVVLPLHLLPPGMQRKI